MLVLTRRAGEQLVIDGDITITVVEVAPGRVKIGVQAPPHVRIDRKEIHERKQNETERPPVLHNRVAALAGVSAVDPRKSR
jgi:carbon storage regulator